MHYRYFLLLAIPLVLQACNNNKSTNSGAKRSGNGNSATAATTTRTIGSTSLALASEPATVVANTNTRGEDELNKMYAESEAGKNALATRKKSTSTQKGPKASRTYGFYPEGSQRKLTENDIKHLSPWGHKVMLNEIYARHGMIFADAALKRHFKRQKWYKGTSKNVYKQLSAIEKQNVAFLINTEPKVIR